MPKKVKPTKAADKVITAETEKKKATNSYQDEINTKTLDLIDTVSENVKIQSDLIDTLSENVKIQSERIDIINQRIDIIKQKLDKVSNRIGIV